MTKGRSNIGLVQSGKSGYPIGYPDEREQLLPSNVSTGERKGFLPTAWLSKFGINSYALTYTAINSDPPHK